MKQIRRSVPVFAVLLLVLAAGCTRPPAVIDFEDSHQAFLEGVVGDLDVAGPVMAAVGPEAVVSVVSMESPRTDDSPLVAMLEDAIVGQLLAAGCTVVERDEDLLQRLVSESTGEGYTCVLFPGNVTVSTADARFAAGPWSYGVGGHAGVTSFRGAREDTFVTFPTNLEAATHIVSYRVLECGLVYRKSGHQGTKKREGRVRLHLRVHDARTGRLVLARNVESQAIDEIDAGSARWLADYHYTLFAPDLPRQQVERGYREVGGATGKAAAVDPAPATPR